MLNTRGFIAILLVLTGLTYIPGISDPFLFDDLGTLPAIGGLGCVDDLRITKILGDDQTNRMI